MKLPEDFEAAKIDLQIDFEGRGGLQRFKTIGDFRNWLDGESVFWKWLSEPPANNHHSHIRDQLNDFNKIQPDCRSQISNAAEQWKRIGREMEQRSQLLENPNLPNEEKEEINTKISQLKEEWGRHIDDLRRTLENTVRLEIVKSKRYLPSTTPSAQFICELAETNPDEAVYALDQILLEEKGASDPRQVGFTGRMMASLYSKHLNRKVREDKRAFSNAIATWTKELADFKSRFESQEREFEEISTRHIEAEENWAAKTTEMAENFANMRNLKEEDLQNLTETYETHMQLKGPLLYWRGKRKEHAKGKTLMGWASAISGLVGAAIIAGSAYLFLPTSSPANAIPWRSIGFFLLISTFVLWLVRLFVKLMLSHIHLYADAREREVMISTFMALMRKNESRQGVEKIDLALVLAPIFKPSTTGVIKDDGGPTTLTDFISRLAGNP